LLDTKNTEKFISYWFSCHS